MYEDLAKRFYEYSDAVKTIKETVPVRKGDLQQAYVAIGRFNKKIEELEREKAGLIRQCHKLAEENGKLEQDFYFLVQQVEGLPPHEKGLKVRLPDDFLPKCEHGGALSSIYAVLRPERDEAAKAALYAYAAATDNAMSRHKILLWLGDETAADEPAAATALDIIADSLAAREKRVSMD